MKIEFILVALAIVAVTNGAVNDIDYDFANSIESLPASDRQRIEDKWNDGIVSNNVKTCSHKYEKKTLF